MMKDGEKHLNNLFADGGTGNFMCIQSMLSIYT